MKQLTGAAKRIFGGLQNRLSKQAKFGQSKHEAKQLAKAEYLNTHGNLDGYNPAKVDGIFSIGTMETYRQAMIPFAEWLSAYNVKNANQITPDLASKYLQEREASGLSAWTVSRDLAAINKAMGYDLSKKELGLSERHKTDISRSRNETENDKRKFSKYQDHIAIAKACGCRRSSITKITPTDCIRNANGTVIGIRVVEKGGKERIAPILNSHKETVTEIVDRLSDGDKPLFSNYDSHIDNHHFRAEYCADLLEQLTQEHNENKPWFGGDLQPEHYIHLSRRDAQCGDTYRGYPTEVVAAVSGAMGHNRLEIIFSHYNYTK